MTRSVSARTARPISRSSNSRRCGPYHISPSIARAIRSRPPSAGRPILNTPRQAALLALSRQPMPLLRREPGNENKSAKGGYVLQEAEGGERKLTILSTGSELHLAVEAREILQKQGIPTAVVSMPCRLLFEQQDAAYKKAVLGETRARVAVEAAVELGWERYIGLEGRFVGMHGFGASGKIADVYKKFDINAEAIVRAAHETLADVAAL